MTIDDLRDAIDGLDGNTEVRLAMQPSWPFEYSIDRAMMKSDVEFDDSRDEDAHNDILDALNVRRRNRGELMNDEVLYLTEGTQLGYVTKKLWE